MALHFIISQFYQLMAPQYQKNTQTSHMSSLYMICDVLKTIILQVQSTKCGILLMKLNLFTVCLGLFGQFYSLLFTSSKCTNWIFLLFYINAKKHLPTKNCSTLSYLTLASSHLSCSHSFTPLPFNTLFRWPHASDFKISLIPNLHQ